jgi:hypothetical protein
MNIEDLYKKLEKIFIEHTTHQWKNGWVHEGDRLSEELTIQKNVPWNNLFLLQETEGYQGKGLSLDGPQGFKIELKMESSLQPMNRIRIDIEGKQMGDIDIFYYVDNELDWLSQQDFIVDLCQNVYDANVILRQAISVVPTGIYGDYNPKFVQSFRRERQLNELGIN